MPAISQEVQWGQDNDVSLVPALSDEEKAALAVRMAALDKLLADAKKAKYKIELIFSYRRRRAGAYPGALALWQSGTKLHGGGDTKLYECPGRSLGRSDCQAFLHDDANGYGHLACGACGTVWKGHEVIGERMARLTTQGWATLLVRTYVRLGLNADIYVKSPRYDVRAMAALEQARPLGGEKLAKARTVRDVYLYPLCNILQDTAQGADLYGRFVAFLSA